MQSSIAVSEVGMYLGESRTAMTKLGSDAVSGRAPNMWYNTTKYGRELVSGRIYFYQAYAVVNGQTYWGEIKTFMPYLVLKKTICGLLTAARMIFRPCLSESRSSR